MLLSKCEVCHGKKLKFIKEQEAIGLLSCLGIQTHLNKKILFGPLLQDIKWMKQLTSFYWQEMPEMHLRQPGFTYSACAFTKNTELIKNSK